MFDFKREFSYDYLLIMNDFCPQPQPKYGNTAASSLKIPKRLSESVNRRRTDNTMAKRQKDRQHNGQKTEGQTTQWPKDRQRNGQKTDNTMAKRQTIQWPKEKVQKDKQRSTKHYTERTTNLTKTREE